MENIKGMSIINETEKSKGKKRMVEEKENMGEIWKERGVREVGEEEEGRRGGNRRRVGRVRRPMNIERLVRERANSMPLLEMFKRGKKRKKKQEEAREIEGMDAFKRSTKIERSPVKEVGGGWEDIVKKMMVGFRELMKEIRES